MARFDSTLIGGWVAKGFEPVHDAFERNFVRRGEVGAACAVYHAGKPVVDLWGGYRERASAARWQKDTLVRVSSATLGPSGLALALAHSRGWLDYDAPVAAYWPEFAEQQKQDITVRRLLSHQAGLPAIDEPLTPAILRDREALATALARQAPAWKPGARHGYHFYTLGLYESELLRRVDPQARSLGRFFQDEIAAPLGLELYIGPPPESCVRRIAAMLTPGTLQTVQGLRRAPLPFGVAWMRRASLTYRAFHNAAATSLAPDAELPSGHGVGQVRSLAVAYGALAAGGARLGLTPETFTALTQPVRAASDAVLRVRTAFSLGFLRPCPAFRFGSTSRALGMPGLGGSVGFADPDTQLGFAYAPNRLLLAFLGDERAEALTQALYTCVG